MKAGRHEELLKLSIRVLVSLWRRYYREATETLRIVEISVESWGIISY